MKCFFWMTAICVAPLVWLMIEATVKRPFEAYFEGLISRIELIPLHRLNFEDQFSRCAAELFPSRMTHCHGSASPYDGPWEDGSQLSDFVSKEIRGLSQLNRNGSIPNRSEASQ